LRVSNKSFLSHFTHLTLVLASCADGLAENLVQGSDQASQGALLLASHTLVLTDLAKTLLTHVLLGASWLEWAAALYWGAEQAAQAIDVRTGLANSHLADLGGNARRRVRNDMDAAAWALHIVSLWVVELLAAVRHSDILAIGSHVDNAALRI